MQHAEPFSHQTDRLKQDFSCEADRNDMMAEHNLSEWCKYILCFFIVRISLKKNLTGQSRTSVPHTALSPDILCSTYRVYPVFSYICGRSCCDRPFVLSVSLSSSYTLSVFVFVRLDILPTALPSPPRLSSLSSTSCIHSVGLLLLLLSSTLLSCTIMNIETPPPR